MRFAPSGLGFRKTAVGLRPLCGFAPAHFFVRGNCFAIPLSRTKKRRIQPERYVQLPQENYVVILALKHNVPVLETMYGEKYYFWI